MNENITVSMGGLNTWFENKMRKYKNSPTEDHLHAVWMMIAGETVQDDSIKTFFEKELTN